MFNFVPIRLNSLKLTEVDIENENHQQNINEDEQVKEQTLKIRKYNF